MKKKLYSVVAALALAGVVAGILFFAKNERPPRQDSSESLAGDPSGKLDAPVEASFASVARVPEAETIDLSQERPSVVETRRMYQAHAILRSDEIDQPDSELNTRLRSEMLRGVLQLAESHQASLKENAAAE